MSSNTSLVNAKSSLYKNLCSWWPDPVGTTHKISTWSHNLPFAPRQWNNLFSCSPSTRMKISSQLVCFQSINVKHHVSLPSNKPKDQVYISTRKSFLRKHKQNSFVISSILHKLITNPISILMKHLLIWDAFVCVNACECADLYVQRKSGTTVSHLKTQMLKLTWLNHISPEMDRVTCKKKNPQNV